MTDKIRKTKILYSVTLNKKNIFLLDGIGAALSLLFTGLVLPLFSDWTGLTIRTLYFLALFPLAYGVYSLSCYWLVKTLKPWMLLGIILANIFYCIVSGVLIFSYDSLTIWGQAILTIEIMVVLAVVAIELNVYRKHFSN